MKKSTYSIMMMFAIMLAFTACSKDSDITSETTTTTDDNGSSDDDDDNNSSGGNSSNTTGSNIATVDASLSNNNVVIAWNSGVSVTIASNLSGLVTAYANGEYVSVLAGSSVSSEITYTLSGSSSNGGFYMDGSYKAAFVLNGIDLTAQGDSAAINIQDGKQITVTLASGTSNKLTDTAGGSNKGCLMLNGHSVFGGTGSLTLYGNANNALWADEYVEIDGGTITVAKAAGDGFNINQYLMINDGIVSISGTGDDGINVSAPDDSSADYNGQVLLYGGTTTVNITATAAKGIKSDGDITMTGGTCNISTSGGGAYDSSEKDATACAAIKAGGNMKISGGTITTKSTGAGGKGISADGTLAITGGTINVTTTGKKYTYSSSATASAKGIKSDGNMTISGGSITVNATGGEGSEGVESDGTMTINDGELYVYAYDDALNCAGNLTINDGKVYAQSANNDAIDANKNVYINGGDIVAIGSTSPEVGIDAAEGYNIYINGGNIVSVGGAIATTSSSSKQCSVAFTGSISGKALSMGSSSSAILYFKAPTTSCQAIMFSSPSLTSGSTYYLKSGASYSGTVYNGLGTTASAITEGSTSVSSAKAALSVGNTSPGGFR